jgi:5-methylcytosine-specific restriction protein A
MKRLEFSRTTMTKRFNFAKGHCEMCGLKLQVGNIEYHHDKEAEDGGDNSFSNCRALCKPCHAPLTAAFVTRIRKADRQKAGQINAKPAPKQPIKSAGFPKREKREPRPSLPPRALYQ